MNNETKIGKAMAWTGIRRLSICIFMLALNLAAQSGTEPAAGTGALAISGQPALVLAPPTGSFTRGSLYLEIDDRNTGDRWLLYRNRNNPAGPGRFVLVGRTAAVAATSPQPKPGLPVIQRGDTVIVIEESAEATGQLEAVALEPAAVGAIFSIRLKLGGRTYRAVASAPGRARFAEDQGAQ